jgi:hypothetical protein
MCVSCVSTVHWNILTAGARLLGNDHELRESEEAERPPLDAATEQRLGKTEKTLCVL